MHQFKEKHLQATTLKVNMASYDLIISAVYCPPKHNLKMDEYKDFFETLGCKFVVGGDFNSKNTLWGSRLTTTKGKELAKLLQEKNYMFLSTGSPTYWPTDINKTPDLLDFFITNGISGTYMDVTPSYDLSSDHSPIIATISTYAINRKIPQKLHNSRTNWDEYRRLLDQQVNLSMRLKEPSEVDEAVETFTNILKQAAIQSTPPIRKEEDKSRSIPIEIKQLIAAKRKAKSRWQLTHAPSDKTDLNYHSNRLKSRLRELQDKSFEQYITGLKRSDYSIWRPIKSKSKPKEHIPPIKNSVLPNAEWARSEQEKANLFAEYLADVFTPNDVMVDDDIEESISNTPQDVPNIKYLTPNEVYAEIKLLNTKKASGFDGITPRMVKELSRKGVVLLTNIFNAIIRLKHWPEALKTAEILMILKPGKNPNDTSSYRPISLLPITSKVLERLILKRINTDIPNNQWIPNHQFGFRQGHSTVQQTHRITQAINQAFEEKKYCTSVFLDVSQAFDKVWHAGLLHKIKSILPLKYFHLLKSYLTNRKFRIRVGQEISGNYPIRAGVPQGSVLGPVLYLLYTSDLPTSTKTILGTFADDTTILAIDEDPSIAADLAQKHLDEVQLWMNKWKIKINETKSKQVDFTLRKERCPQIRLNNTTIPQTTSAKYLGFHLDSKLTWKEHILKKRKQMELKTRELLWLIGRKSKLSMENKILLYKTIITPIWTYGIEIWGCASKSNIALLQRCQSKILRIIANAPWYVTNQTLHDDLSVPYIVDVIKRRTQQHHTKLEGHPNVLLQPLLEKHEPRRLRRQWPADLI